MTEIASIIRLGHRGDGVTEAGVHVPFTLPGERVAIEPDGGERARPLEIVDPSAERIVPVCPHFGRCGGCALQHMSAPAYLEWKREQVIAALAQRGLDAEVKPTRPLPIGSRRRAVLTAKRDRDRVRLGYRARLSHDFVAAGPCPILTPAIEQALPRLADLVAPLVRDEARVTVLDTSAGFDVSLEGAKPDRAPAAQADLSRRALAAGVARLAIGGETVIEHAPPALYMGGVAVVPPPGSFVQASEAAEIAMAGLVLEAVGRARVVADLFAGIGTFALRLARRARVTAIEGNRAAIEALDRAVRRATGLKPVTAVVRDLERRPLLPQELKDFDAVVFDPPRAGAKPQAERLAMSRVPAVVAVSCNPASFARDARILVDGGYILSWVGPVDQFLFSPHIELVAAFRRA